jgi:hypothetical protein
MEKILEKARIILRNVYVALGATAMPFLIHAAYGMREPDRSSYTVPVEGRVVSEETGEPIAGISVWYNAGWDRADADTGSDGHFFFYVPEEDSYAIGFFDRDGFESGGYFSYKNMTITRDEITDPLEVSLYRESQVTVIHGKVRSQGTGEPVSGISVSIDYQNESGSASYTPFTSRFAVLSDKNGQFSIQVPERDAYFIYFYDANGLFQRKTMNVSAGEIKDPLQVDLEQNPGKDGE